jgi:hypothetical protein
LLDPLSMKVMMSISLLMPVFSFLGMLITLKRAKRLFASGSLDMLTDIAQA